jgi:hypothetical protein
MLIVDDARSVGNMAGCTEARRGPVREPGWCWYDGMFATVDKLLSVVTKFARLLGGARDTYVRILAFHLAGGLRCLYGAPDNKVQVLVSVP